MNDRSRLIKLAGHLQAEIRAAKAGDSQGQFPILDLIGNLRDEAGADAGLAAFVALCSAAWERVVRIVESGKPFTADEIAWLHDFLAQAQAMAGPADSSTAAATPAPVAPKEVEIPPDAATFVEEPPLVLNTAADADLLREFITESREHLDNIEQGILVLENSPTDAEKLNTIFRAFHTFKGGAGFLNLLPINRLAHVLESLLDLARQGTLTIDSPVIELILRGRDVLKQFVDEIDGQLSGARPAQPIAIPTALLKAEVQEAIETAVASGQPKAENPTNTTGEPATPDQQAAAPVAESPQLKVETSPKATAEPAASKLQPVASPTMVKVDTAKLDGLLDLVGEMVIAQSLVSQGGVDLATANPLAARNLAQLGRITKELQRVSMALRMVPIRGVFQKMSRVVRDIAAKQQKKVNFATSGEDTELDRTVVIRCCT